jgi:hypothetical protein
LYQLLRFAPISIYAQLYVMKKFVFNLKSRNNHPLSKKAFGMAVLLFLAAFVSAQKISGTVTDATGKAQEFASVMLMSAKDSTLTKGAI